MTFHDFTPEVPTLDWRELKPQMEHFDRQFQWHKYEALHPYGRIPIGLGARRQHWGN